MFGMGKYAESDSFTATNPSEAGVVLPMLGNVTSLMPGMTLPPLANRYLFPAIGKKNEDQPDAYSRAQRSAQEEEVRRADGDICTQNLSNIVLKG